MTELVPLLTADSSPSEKDWSSFSVVDKWSQCVTKKFTHIVFSFIRFEKVVGATTLWLWNVIYYIMIGLYVCVSVSRQKETSTSVHQSEWMTEWKTWKSFMRELLSW